jgi:hypothetical protein
MPASRRTTRSRAVGKSSRSAITKKTKQKTRDYASRSAVRQSSNCISSPQRPKPASPSTEGNMPRQDQTSSEAVRSSSFRRSTPDLAAEDYKESIQPYDRNGVPRKPDDIAGDPFYTMYKELNKPPFTYWQLWAMSEVPAIFDAKPARKQKIETKSGGSSNGALRRRRRRRRKGDRYGKTNWRAKGFGNVAEGS